MMHNQEEASAMSFSSLPSEKPQPPRVAVLKALNLFIERPVSAVLESKWDLLLSDLAEQTLTERINRLEASSGPGAAITLKFYRWFLCRARQQRIAVACEELRYLTDSDYRQSFIEFHEILLDHHTWRERRQVLEEHLELLNPELDRPLKIYAIMIEQNPDIFAALAGKKARSDLREAKRFGNDLHLLLTALREAREHGGTVESLRRACTNFFGGLALDAPPWFIKQEKQYLDLLHQHRIADRQKGQEQANTDLIQMLRKLIERSQEDTQVQPETLAELRIHLITRISQANLYEREQKDYEEIIQIQQEVLKIYTRERYPYCFALAQKRMGDAYIRFAKNGRRQNLEAAIRCYSSTIEIATKELSPVLWAETQIDLAHAYYDRMAGSRAKNIELSKEASEAALQVFTRQDFPDEWASAQHALANAYFSRIEGQKADNVECAMMHYHLALQEIKRDKDPHSWGTGHYSLGNCYIERIEGTRRHNIEQAITYFKLAEQALTDERFRLDWAMVQSGLGLAYVRRIEDVQLNNIELAISYFQYALEVFTPDATPKEWTAVQHNLGSAYWKRLEGARNENLEQAILCFEKAERVCPRQEDPFQWAMIQFSLGNAYSDRMEGDHQKNLLRAISCYQAAAQVWKLPTYPREWALTWHHLGSAYNKMRDREQAITCYKAALQHFTPEDHPYDWSGLQRNLAVAYQKRTVGNRRENLQQAITHLEAALTVQTRQHYPMEWAGVQEILGSIYREHPDKAHSENVQAAIARYEAALQVYRDNGDLSRQRSVLLRLGNTEAEREHWGAADIYFSEACDVEETLSLLSTGAMGRDLIRGEMADASTRSGYARMRLGQYAQAAAALERGQARDLAEGLSLHTDRPDKIQDPERRNRYDEAKKRWARASKVVNTSPDTTPSKQPPAKEAEQRQQRLQAIEVCRQADHDFKMIVQEILTVEGFDVLQQEKPDASTILKAAGQIGPQHALAYLAATPWGGFALVALPTAQHTKSEESFFAVNLPRLTTHLIAGLLDSRSGDGTNTLLGGYAYAQQGQGLGLLDPWRQPGKTFRETASLLHQQCTACQQESGLDYAAQKVLTLPDLASLIDLPLDDINKNNAIVYAFEHAFLHHELERCFEVLRTCALSPLLTALQEHAIASLTLIPCGWLAAFPLTTVTLENGQTVGDTIPTSTAPSARSIQHEDTAQSQRSSVFALGDPRPTRPDMELKWGEAEAHAIARLAELLDFGQRSASVHDQVTHANLVKALANGLVVDISCHGAFNYQDFRLSSLQLANMEHLYLGELLSHTVELRGLRLLILSACQTAVLDLNGAVNEVRSLASGVLQCGAQGILASLWSVNELATYLLIVYFARQWLPQMQHTPPAEALAKAQQWLRKATWQEIQQEIQQWDTKPVISELVSKDRYEHAGVLYEVSKNIKKHAPGLRPFASPVHWAGFQVTGW